MNHSICLTFLPGKTIPACCCLGLGESIQAFTLGVHRSLVNSFLSVTAEMLWRHWSAPAEVGICVSQAVFDAGREQHPGGGLRVHLEG